MDTTFHALLVALFLSGCASYGGDDVGSGIFGVATIGPTCPVERDPPDPACADRPYEGMLRVSRTDGGEGGSFSTDAAGAFNVSLTPGEYLISSPNDATPPTCSAPGPIIVVRGEWTRVPVSCDSGIR